MTSLHELVERLRPEGVPYLPLGSVVAYRQPGSFLVSSANYDPSFSTPVLTAGQTFILGHTDETEGIYPASPESPVVIFDDFTTAFKWVDFPFKAKSSAMKLLTSADPSFADLRYLYFAMQTIRHRPQEHARQWIGTYSGFRVPIPPLEVQRSIVNILESFPNLEADLEAELKARRDQFRYYRDSLMNPRWDCEWLTLGEVALDFGRGKSRHRPRNDPRLYGGPYPFIQTGDVRNSGHHIDEYSQTYSEEGLAQSKLWPRGTICITIAANIADTGILNFDACFPDSVIGLVVDPERASTGYVEYLLQSLKSNLVAEGKGSAQANINLATFDEMRFPFPELEEQERIAGLLDRFDALVNDLSIGLPAELAARRKQYEYYRDRLLTFEETSA